MASDDPHLTWLNQEMRNSLPGTLKSSEKPYPLSMESGPSTMRKFGFKLFKPNQAPLSLASNQAIPKPAAPAPLPPPPPPQPQPQPFEVDDADDEKSEDLVASADDEDDDENDEDDEPGSLDDFVVQNDESQEVYVRPKYLAEKSDEEELGSEHELNLSGGETEMLTKSQELRKIKRHMKKAEQKDAEHFKGLDMVKIGYDRRQDYVKLSKKVYRADDNVSSSSDVDSSDDSSFPAAAATASGEGIGSNSDNDSSSSDSSPSFEDESDETKEKKKQRSRKRKNKDKVKVKPNELKELNKGVVRTAMMNHKASERQTNRSKKAAPKTQEILDLVRAERESEESTVAPPSAHALPPLDPMDVDDDNDDSVPERLNDPQVVARIQQELEALTQREPVRLNNATLPLQSAHSIPDYWAFQFLFAQVRINSQVKHQIAMNQQMAMDAGHGMAMNNPSSRPANEEVEAQRHKLSVLSKEADMLQLFESVLNKAH